MMRYWIQHLLYYTAYLVLIFSTDTGANLANLVPLMLIVTIPQLVVVFLNGVLRYWIWRLLYYTAYLVLWLSLALGFPFMLICAFLNDFLESFK